MRLFVLLPHLGGHFQTPHHRLVALGKLCETLINVHLANSISEAGLLSAHPNHQWWFSTSSPKASRPLTPFNFNTFRLATDLR
jgi:hypothetical protein